MASTGQTGLIPPGNLSFFAVSNGVAAPAGAAVGTAEAPLAGAAGDNDNKRQRVTVLKNQQLSPQKIGFDIGLFSWFNPCAQFDRNFLDRRRSHVFHNQ